MITPMWCGSRRNPDRIFQKSLANSVWTSYLSESLPNKANPLSMKANQHLIHHSHVASLWDFGHGTIFLGACCLMSHTPTSVTLAEGNFGSAVTLTPCGDRKGKPPDIQEAMAITSPGSLVSMVIVTYPAWWPVLPVKVMLKAPDLTLLYTWETLLSLASSAFPCCGCSWTAVHPWKQPCSAWQMPSPAWPCQSEDCSVPKEVAAELVDLDNPVVPSGSCHALGFLLSLKLCMSLITFVTSLWFCLSRDKRIDESVSFLFSSNPSFWSTLWLYDILSETWRSRLQL